MAEHSQFTSDQFQGSPALRLLTIVKSTFLDFTTPLMRRSMGIKSQEEEEMEKRPLYRQKVIRFRAVCAGYPLGPWRDDINDARRDLVASELARYSEGGAFQITEPGDIQIQEGGLEGNRGLSHPNLD